MLTSSNIVNSDVNAEGNICQTWVTVVAPFTLGARGLVCLIWNFHHSLATTLDTDHFYWYIQKFWINCCKGLHNQTNITSLLWRISFKNITFCSMDSCLVVHSNNTQVMKRLWKVEILRNQKRVCNIPGGNEFKIQEILRDWSQGGLSKLND